MFKLGMERRRREYKEEKKHRNAEVLKNRSVVEVVRG